MQKMQTTRLKVKRFRIGYQQAYRPCISDFFERKKILKKRAFKKNILKAYIIGNNISFFKNQLKNKVNFEVLKSLKRSVKKVIRDVKIFNKRKKFRLLSKSNCRL